MWWSASDELDLMVPFIWLKNVVSMSDQESLMRAVLPRQAKSTKYKSDSIRLRAVYWCAVVALRSIDASEGLVQGVFRLLVEVRERLFVRIVQCGMQFTGAVFEAGDKVPPGTEAGGEDEESGAEPGEGVVIP